MTTLLSIGPVNSITEDVVYALPAQTVYLTSAAVIQTSNVVDSGFADVAASTTGTVVSALFVKCSTGNTTVTLARAESATGVGISQLTGQVTAGPGLGSVAATIVGPVTNAMLADMAAGTYKMRVTGSTGDPEDGTATQATAGLNNLVGDSGSGGTKGLAPAPAAGDAAANKFLKASGAWAAVPAVTLSIQKLTFTIDGGGSALTATGLQKYFSFPFTGTINRVRVLGDASGNIVFDIWKDTWANRPPTNADSITASAKPTLSSAQFYEDTTLTGWTTSVTAGDLGGIEIESVSTLTWAILEIFIQPA